MITSPDHRSTPKWEVADIFRTHGNNYRHANAMTAEQHKVMSNRSNEMVAQWEPLCFGSNPDDPYSRRKQRYRIRCNLGLLKGVAYFTPYNRYADILEPGVQADKLVTVRD